MTKPVGKRGHQAKVYDPDLEKVEVRTNTGVKPTRTKSKAGPTETFTPGQPLPVRSNATYATAKGDFTTASAAEAEQLRRTYLRSKETGLARPPEGNVSRVTAKDLAVDLGSLNGRRTQTLLDAGTQELRSFYYFTSGAGLWSRGGGQVKAIVPLNLRELLSATELSALSAASDIVNAKSPADVLFIAHRDVPEGKSLDEVSAAVVSEAKATIERILGKARRDERSLPPLAMKFVEVALASQVAGTHVPFDVWTSEQTHQAIADYVTDFKQSFARKVFDPDPAVQAAIVDALRSYFAAADAKGETHLFGKQRGFHALDPETGRPLEGTATIGEGAGRAKAYLDETGRSRELLDQGKTTWVFENIEVLSDLRLLLGAHAEAGKEASVVLVPQRQGYAGGNPFLIGKPDGSQNLELHEQSALPPEYAKGNEWFNSNTIFQPLLAEPPQTLGFEVKNNGTQVRAKQNAGDVTHHLSTAGIGGRIGLEYENLKTYPEYAENGVALIDRYREVWAREVAAAKSGAATSGQLDWT